ncbi:acyl-CoA dehydrogenase family protein [Streptomyces sp. B1866]|uniref:acyl-CoA dehydrogenase family protein n=1 Tax=Streptomyces sp. B1866 TaxID=3075431 RepID=UPI00289287D7|nr:acyl-CoA dehydrogenase family protein [Streptomyces sp. B1866]MDT3398951.1 acyl-CoA dehydrogenase family protein [Streptomyces sp. B1866]
MADSRGARGPAADGPGALREFSAQDVPAYLRTHPEDRYPRELVRRLAELGVLGVTVPRAYGGGTLPEADAGRVGYELGRSWQSLAGLVGTHLKLCRLVLKHGTEQQRSELLPAMARGRAVWARAYHERSVGDPTRMRTTARTDAGPTKTGRADAARSGTGLTGTLTGRKDWVTNARHADRILVLARSGDATVGVLADPRRAGLRIGPELPRPGLWGVSLAEVDLREYPFDPDTEILGGPGHDLTPSLRTYGVAGYAARAAGSADAVYACAREAVAGGVGSRADRARGAIELRLGELATRRATIDAAYRALSLPDPPMSPEQAKVVCTTVLQDLLRSAVQLCGGAGYAGPGPLGRHYRDALALTVIGVPNDTLLSRIGALEISDQFSGKISPEISKEE